MRWLVLVSLALAGCQNLGDARLSGTIGSKQLTDVAAVYHGGPFLMFFDREVDCLDVAWVAKSYNQAQAPTDEEFVALQFAFDEQPMVGTFSVAGESAATAYGLINEGGVFELYRGQEGTITITDEGPGREDPVVGTFQVTFAEGGAINGEFETVWCRNLRD